MLSSRHRRTGCRWGQEEAMAHQESSQGESRRAFLKMVAGAATGAAVAGGIPAIVAAQKAPSFPKGTRLNVLEWVSFVPASDVEFKRLAAEFGKLAGVEVTVDQINMNDLNPRIASAIETRSGPDIIMMISNWPHLYADGLADVDDVAEEIAKRDGAYYEHNRKVSVVDNRWKAVPLCSVPSTWTYRDDWFKEAGATKFPDTWDELRKVGFELKKKGRPLGQAVFEEPAGGQGVPALVHGPAAVRQVDGGERRLRRGPDPVLGEARLVGAGPQARALQGGVEVRPLARVSRPA